jgi:hypothetical protein
MKGGDARRPNTEELAELEVDAAALRPYVEPLGDILGLAEADSHTHRLT